MKMIEIIPYKPWILINDVKNAEEAELESRNDSEWILLTNKQFKERMKNGL